MSTQDRTETTDELIPETVFAAATRLSEEDAERALNELWDAGLVLMPIEPTRGMILAGQTEHENCIDSDWDSGSDGESYNYTTIAPDAPLRVYRAMVAAAWPEDEDTE